MAAEDLDPSRINRYATELASRFHRFYNACRIRGEAKDVAEARLALAAAGRTCQDGRRDDMTAVCLRVEER